MRHITAASLAAPFKALFVALSVYSAIPVPQIEWNDGSLAWPFCFLPAVGVVIAALCAAWLALAARLGFGTVLTAAVASLIPLIVTGGIHMDGYCDTVDALSSHQSAERCLEIMKDSHSGAFAGIFAAAYLLAAFALVTETLDRPAALGTVFVLSRAVSILSVSGKKNARGTGMLASFQKPLHARAVRIAAAAWILLGLIATATAGRVAAPLAALAVIATWAAYHRTAFARFGGITGDTSGFFVQVLELALLAALAVAVHL